MASEDSDFDGQADILLRRTDGKWFLYLMDGITVLDSSEVDMTTNTDWVPMVF